MPTQEPIKTRRIQPRVWSLDGTFSQQTSVITSNWEYIYASDLITFMEQWSSGLGTDLVNGERLGFYLEKVGPDPNVTNIENAEAFKDYEVRDGTDIGYSSPLNPDLYYFSVTEKNIAVPSPPTATIGKGASFSIFGGRDYSLDFAQTELPLPPSKFGTYRLIAYWGDPFIAPPTNPGDPLEDAKGKEIDTFELRGMEVTHFQTSLPSVPLVGLLNPTVTVEGKITVYPNPTYNDGTPAWMPGEPISCRIEIGHPDLDRADWIRRDITLSVNSPNEEGIVSTFSENFDLGDIVTAFAAMSRTIPTILQMECRAIVATEAGRNTATPLAKEYIFEDDRDRREKPCEPPWSCNAYGLPSAQQSALSAAPESGLTMTGNNFEDTPESFGHGWQLSAYKYIKEDDDGNLTLHDGTGRIERWIPEGSTYHPVHKNNRIQANKTGSSVTLTFLDKSVMEFIETNNTPTKFRIETWTDSNGIQSSYSYDTSDRLTKVEDGLGRSTNFSYSGTNLQPSSITSHAGVGGARTTNFSYTGGRLSSITDPEGLTMSYAYTSEGRISSITDSIGVAVSYTYSSNPLYEGRVETETFYGERRNTYTYDDSAMTITITEQDLVGSGGTRSNVYHLDLYRNVIKIVDSLGNEIHRDFDEPHDPYLLTKVTTPNGSTRHTYNADGVMTSVTDANLNKTSITYGNSDFPLLPTAVIRPANGGRTEMSYDGAGNLLTVKDALNQTTTMAYDSQGFMTSLTDRNGHTTLFEYGGSPKNLTKVKNPKEGGGFREVSFEYDGFDNITRAVDDLGQEVNVTFDKLDRAIQIEDARNNVTTFNFDPVKGLLNSILSPVEIGGVVSTRETAMTYDSTGRLEEVIRDLTASTTTSRVKYEFDGFSQLRKLTRKKHSTASKAYEFTYDSLGRARTAKDTENKTTTIHYAPFCLRQATDSARGIRTVQHFDNLCRLHKVEVGTPDASDELKLATVTETRDFDYDDLNRLVSSTQKPVSFSSDTAKYGVAKYGTDLYSASDEEDGLIRTYQYDALDRLTGVVFEDLKTASFEYWPEGQLKRMVDPDGKVTLYEYHPNGSLAKVKIERDEVVVGEFAYAYDAVGLPESITYPEDTDIVAEFKSSSSARGWNENGQLTHLRYLKSGVPIREFEFDYDAAGNRTKQIDISSAGTFEWKYSYDYLDRLSKVEKKTGAGPMLEMSIYAYDESDNRTVLELPQDLVKFIYGYDDADRITTMEKATTSNVSIFTDTFVSDDDGNVLTKTKTTVGSSDVTETSYTWDSFNKLIAVSSKLNGTPTNDAKQENSYLANGFRRKKKAKSGEVTTEYSAGLSTAMAKAGSDPISYIQGHHILGFEQGDSFYWFLTDALGSVRDIVSGTDGAVLQSYEYRENGEKTSSTTLKSDKTWIGGLSVNDDTADSGLYLMGHRHYDASLGRFLSRDPIGFAGGLNLYEYAGSSPVDSVDPEGLQTGMGSRADARWIKHRYPDIGNSSDPYGDMIGNMILANATLALGPPAWRLWASSLVRNPVTTTALTEAALAGAAGYPGPSASIPTSAGRAVGTASAVAGKIPCNLPRIPMPAIPKGMTPSQFGKLIGWGRQDAEALGRIGSVAPGPLRAGGVTSQMARDWAHFYEYETMRVPGNPSSKGRASLMHHIAKILE